MINRVVSLIVLFGLAACAPPTPSEQKAAGAPDDVVLAEPVIEAAPTTADRICEDPEDGFGGTGCSVD